MCNFFLNGSIFLLKIFIRYSNPRDGCSANACCNTYPIEYVLCARGSFMAYNRSELVSRSRNELKNTKGIPVSIHTLA